jgi:two-component system sensor histidine kinase/response regulator
MNTTMKNLNANILIVDDQDENLFLLEFILSQIGCSVETINDSRKTLDTLVQKEFDLIILDVLMPYIDGFELCTMIKEDKNLQNIPVMFISSLEDEKDIVKAFEVGAVDYITKPIKKLEVIARVENQLKYKMKYSNLSATMQFAFHELQTPINVIYNDNTLIEEKFGHTKSNERIDIALKILQSIYLDLYYTVKKDEFTQTDKKVALSEIIETYTEYFELAKIDKKQQIITNVENVPMVSVPEIALSRLVSNTISNSIKYSPTNSIIEINVKSMENKILYQISNETTHQTDFNLFFKSGYKDLENVKGLGIGLEIIRQICLDFKIEVDVLKKDKRVTFSFLIPSP